MRILHASSLGKELNFTLYTCEFARVSNTAQTKAGQGIDGENAPNV